GQRRGMAQSSERGFYARRELCSPKECGTLPAARIAVGHESRQHGYGARSMHPTHEHLQTMTRRHFFGRAALGLGVPALASLLAQPAGAGAAPAPTGGLPGLPHFAPKAKRAIYLFMNGGPSQMDLFD